MKSNSSKEAALVLSDIRSMENVGSLFRTADAAGITKLYLAGITPAPIDRFGREVATIAKTALGAQKTMPWEKVDKVLPLLNRLKEGGYQIVAIEQGEISVDYKTIDIAMPCAFVLGNEVEGLSKEILAISDIVAEIPMRGKKESLNVAVAGGIALFRMLDC